MPQAASTLGVNEKVFNKQVKLGNTCIFHEYRKKVHIPRPFNQNVFYYVSDNGMNANESKMLSHHSASMGAHVHWPREVHGQSK